jgi:hypothetical protein
MLSLKSVVSINETEVVVLIFAEVKPEKPMLRMSAVWSPWVAADMEFPERDQRVEGLEVVLYGGVPRRMNGRMLKGWRQPLKSPPR